MRDFYVDIREEYGKQRRQPVQRPWDRIVLGRLEEQQGGLCVSGAE